MEVSKDTVRRIAVELWGTDLEALGLGEADIDQLVAEVRVWQQGFKGLAGHDPMADEPFGNPDPTDG